MFAHKMKIFEITTAASGGNLSTAGTKQPQLQEKELTERTLRNGKPCTEKSSSPIYTGQNLQSQQEIEKSLVSKLKYLNKNNNKRGNNHENVSDEVSCLIENNQSEGRYCKRQSQQTNFGNFVHRKKWNNMQQQQQQQQQNPNPNHHYQNHTYQKQMMNSPRKHNNNNAAVKNQNLILTTSPNRTTKNPISFTSTTNEQLLDNKNNGKAQRKGNATYKNISKENTLPNPLTENQTCNYSRTLSSTQSMEINRQTTEQKSSIKQDRNNSYQSSKADNMAQKSNNTPRPARRNDANGNDANTNGSTTGSANTSKPHRMFSAFKKKTFWRSSQTQSPRLQRSPKTGYETKKSVSDNSTIKVLRPMLTSSLTASSDKINTSDSSGVSVTSKSPASTPLSNRKTPNGISPNLRTENKNAYNNEDRGWSVAKKNLREQQHNHQQQQQRQQQHYYPSPQQLTIASFLQKDLLTGQKNAENGNNDDQQFGSRQLPQGYSGFYHQQPRYHGRFNDRHGNAHGYSQQQQQQNQHQQHQQQQQHIIYPYHMSQQNHHYVRRNKHNTGKKSNPNYIQNLTNSNLPPPSITSLSSSSSSVCSSTTSTESSNIQQRSKQESTNQVGAGETLYMNNYNSSVHRAVNQSNSYFYQPNFNAGHRGGLQFTGATTPTNSLHQNFFNLTYVNMDPVETSGTSLPTYLSSPMSSSSGCSSNRSNQQQRIKQSSQNIESGNNPVMLQSNNQCVGNQENQQVRIFPTPTSIDSPASQVSAAPFPSANIISCSQLDEAITSAAAANNDLTTTISSVPAPLSIDIVSELQQVPQPQVSMIPGTHFTAIPLLHVPQQHYSPHHNLPLSPHDEQPPTPQQSNQQHAQNEQLIIGFDDGVSWSQTSTSPCFQQAAPTYTFSTSPHGHHFNNGQHASSGAFWNNRRPTDLQQPNPYGSIQQQQEVSQRISRQQHQLHVPPGLMLPQHFRSIIRCCPGATAGMNIPQYEHITPADRFLARVRNIEIKDPPANFVQKCKYDRISQDMWNRFKSSQQSQSIFVIKMHLWRYLYLMIKQTYPRYGLYLVGSTMTGFSTNKSDIDLCLVSKNIPNGDNRHEAIYVLQVVKKCLENNVKCNFCGSGEFQNYKVIEARVPILRFTDAFNKIDVDLNFNNSVGIKNTHLLRLYSQLDWRTRPLVVLVKLWAQHHDINDAKNSTISSYSLVLMVIHFLQYGCHPHVLPCLHTLYPNKFQPYLNEYNHLDLTEVIEPYDTKNQQTIGQLLVEFLKYYSCFDFSNNAISVRTGGILSVNECRNAKSFKNDNQQWKILNIEEPFDLSNTARSVYDLETFERIKDTFNVSWHLLEESLDLNSIFPPKNLQPSEGSITQDISSKLYMSCCYRLLLCCLDT